MNANTAAQASENNSSKKAFSETAVADFARELAKTLEQKSSVNIEASKKLVGKLEKFGEIGEKASLFEMGMAGLGAVSSGFAADWIAYFLESFGERAENAFVSGRELPSYIKLPMQGLASVFGIKNQDGSRLNKSEDFVAAQKNLIGAINTSLSSASLLNIALRTLPKVLRGEEEKEDKSGFFHMLTTKVLPLINAALMWAFGSGKRHITHAINEIHQNGYKSKTDGAWTSGMQDYYCGSNSLALMLRQAIGVFSPKLARIAEPIFGAWISGSSFVEGMRALRNEEEVADYKLTGLDNSMLGKASYSLAQMISKPFGLELPSLTKLKDAVKKPEILI